MSQPELLVPEAIRNQSIFADWVATNMFPFSNTSCSSRILVYPASLGSRSPRDKYLSPPDPPSGWAESRVAEHAGCPDYVLPIGQTSLHSDITGQQEVEPIVMGITAGKDCDGMLFDLVNAMMKEGMLNTNQPGRSLVDGGEILF